MEYWKIIEHRPRYEVSNRGRVRRIKTGRVLRAGLSDGYLHVVLTHDKWPNKTLTVHRLVLFAFRGAPGLAIDHPQCRHLDGSRTNNLLSNLVWGSAKDNATDRIAHGTQQRGAGCPQSKLTAANVLEIRDRSARGETQRALAAHFGVRQQSIFRIVNNQSWTHI